MNILKMKNMQMIVLTIFFTQNFYSQQALGQGGNTSIASPSMASMSLYTDIPVNLSAGIPNINFPIVEVPILDQNIKNIFSLAYNPAFVDATENHAASDVGAGWTLFGGSVIYKKIINDLDERLDDPSLPHYEKNIFDDYYYYNLPGLSGKFQIKRDIVNNTFNLINLTPNNVKFEYQRDSNNATLKINTFTVTDGKGYKFFFTDYDYETIPDGYLITGKGYKSSFLLSRIENSSGKVLVTFTYDKKSKSTSSNKLIYQYCKLKTVETDLGKVIFDYQYDESLADTPNDLYSLQKITLKNTFNQIINTYTFNYIKSAIPSTAKKQKRLLAFFKKNDQNDVKIEQTSFTYNQGFNFPAMSTGICNWGGSVDNSYYDSYQFTNLLEKVITPSGRVVKHEFGFNEYFFDYNQAYFDSILYGYVDSDVQTTQSQPQTSFDTSQSSTYTFTIAGDPTKKIGFNIVFQTEDYHDNPEPILQNPLNPNHGNPPAFYTQYKIKNSTGEYLTKKGCIYGESYWQNTYYGYPGTYTMQINGTGHGYGYFIVSEVKLKPQPYKNVKKAPSVAPRINSIKYYKGINDTYPARTTNYNYDNENGTASSGYIYYEAHDEAFMANEPIVLYKNVKVSEEGKGYTRNTYITPNDYPKYQNGGTPLEPTYYYPYYNITKESLLSETKAYNEQNQLLSSENLIYEFDHYIDQTYQFYINSSPYESKPAYIKKITSTSKDYTKNGGVVENKRESWINKSNLSPSQIKETSANGDLQEREFIYAPGTAGYTHLENAYMITEPIQTINKNNGKIVSNSKIKFDNNSFQPTSVISVNPNDNSVKTSVKYDAYDTKGNLRQFTMISDEATGQGTSTTFIWGYNDTYPIAKVEGATINDIGSLGSDIITKSNSDTDDASEKTLIQALDTFRSHSALKNFLITTYTYNPLVGITSTTSPDGFREIYQYNSHNKLQYILDVNGNIVKDYRYNTKPQP